MLPCGVSIKDILSLSSFLSPQLIIEHGSNVTNIRYSPDGCRDIDIIIASVKKSFWPTDYLYEHVKNNFRKDMPDLKFDLTLVSPRELIFNIHQETSLGESLRQGFTILYPEKTNAIK
ncbi:MAG: hypothetical protein ABR985_12960 [Methanotrichaceae archaeon]|jgi:hypothetical protein